VTIDPHGVEWKMGNLVGFFFHLRSKYNRFREAVFSTAPIMHGLRLDLKFDNFDKQKKITKSRIINLSF